MMDGLIQYLLSPAAEELRRHFVFKIVPILNPDGVIYGNYRCSLLGCDLNRKWEKPNKFLHPTIYYSKFLIRNTHIERKVVLFCDLHGHSRKYNAFFFGCCYKNYEHEGRIKNAYLRIIPLLCSKQNRLFSFPDCRFRIERSKESTARVVVFKEFNIANSFTLECSFFGREECPDSVRNNDFTHLLQKEKKQNILQFSVPEYNSLGTSFMQVLHYYLPSEAHKLQFLSGRILDVFYEEFVKFIP